MKASSCSSVCGASLGVYAQNPPHIVAEFEELLNLNPEAVVTDKKKGEMSLHHALSHEAALNRVTKKFVKEWFARLPEGDAKAKLAQIVENDEQLDAFIWDRDYIDVIKEFPGASFDSGEIMDFLPKANPRLYSIASGPAAYPTHVHLTIAVVEYETHGRKKIGLASGWLAHHTRLNEPNVPVYVQPSKHFHLPENPETPMIMVGPGTGIAPFRSFLQERKALGHKGKSWLFFGDQHAATDFLYEDELKAMQAEGYLERLDTAFSRDQEHKVYVQDRMRENGEELWKWIQEGAYFFVCGDAKRMAKDVHQALIDIASQYGGMDLETAKDWVEKTFAREEKRYLKDVY